MIPMQEDKARRYMMDKVSRLLLHWLQLPDSNQSGKLRSSTHANRPAFFLMCPVVYDKMVHAVQQTRHNKQHHIERVKSFLPAPLQKNTVGVYHQLLPQTRWRQDFCSLLSCET